MIHKFFIYSLLILTFFNCKSQFKNDKDSYIIKKNLINKKASDEKWIVYNSYHESKLYHVKILETSSNEILFQIIIDSNNSKIIEKKGRAILRNSSLGNSELGEDENGEVYNVIPYDYVGNMCTITIYIEYNFGKRLVVVPSNECNYLIKDICNDFKCQTLKRVD